MVGITSATGQLHDQLQAIVVLSRRLLQGLVGCQRGPWPSRTGRFQAVRAQHGLALEILGRLRDCDELRFYVPGEPRIDSLGAGLRLATDSAVAVVSSTNAAAHALSQRKLRMGHAVDVDETEGMCDRFLATALDNVSVVVELVGSAIAESGLRPLLRLAQ